MNLKHPIFHTILYLSLLITFVFLYMQNPADRLLVTTLASAFTLLQIVRYRILEMSLLRWPGLLLFLLQWVIVFVLQIIDGTFIPQIYFFIMITEAALRAPIRFSGPFTILCYLGFALGVYFHFGMPPFGEVSFVLPRMMEYGMNFAFCYTARMLNDQKEELNRAHDKLKAAHLQLEEKTLMEERMRISRDIHDLIGHTLTTALVGMEAGKQLALHQRTEQAVAKLEQARTHVLESLQQVRKSVHTLYEQKSFIRFKESLLELIDRTEQVAGVRVLHAIEGDLPPMSAQQEITVYRALQEGLTNGIRHGRSSEFRFALRAEDGNVQFELTDNGTMPKKWKLGFGLSAMRERVVKLGGQFGVDAVDGGCRLRIRLPLHAAETISEIS